MSNLGNLFADIPEAVWGAVVGAAIALAGVAAQLWHDRKERERERRFAIKRDVHVEAAEALASAQNFLASFGRTEVPISEQTSMLHGNPGWLIKLHIFAGYQAIAAVTVAGDYFTDAASELVAKRFAFEMLASRLSGKESQRDQLSGRQQAIAGAPAGACRVASWRTGAGTTTSPLGNDSGDTTTA